MMSSKRVRVPCSEETCHANLMFVRLVPASELRVFGSAMAWQRASQHVSEVFISLYATPISVLTFRKVRALHLRDLLQDEVRNDGLFFESMGIVLDASRQNATLETKVRLVHT